jgi:hypothetical protein
MKLLKEFVSYISESLGFSSFSDLFRESLLLDGKYIKVHLFGFTVSASIMFINSLLYNYHLFVEHVNIHIYSPSKAIFLLFIITLVDVWLGTTKSMASRTIDGPKLPESINGNKFVKSFFKFTVQVFFVSFLYNVSNLYGAFNSSWVVHSLMIAFITGTLISAWNNAYLIGFIDKEVHSWLLGIFDLKNLFKRRNNKLDDNG